MQKFKIADLICGHTTEKKENKIKDKSILVEFTLKFILKCESWL